MDVSRVTLAATAFVESIAFSFFIEQSLGGDISTILLDTGKGPSFSFDDGMILSLSTVLCSFFFLFFGNFVVAFLGAMDVSRVTLAATAFVESIAFSFFH